MIETATVPVQRERAGIIGAVTSPMGFFALVVLTIEAALVVLAARTTGTVQVVLACGLLVGLFGLAIAVPVLAYYHPEIFHSQAEREREAKEEQWRNAVQAVLDYDEPMSVEEVMRALGFGADDAGIRVRVLSALGWLRMGEVAQKSDEMPGCWLLVDDA